MRFVDGRDKVALFCIGPRRISNRVQAAFSQGNRWDGRVENGERGSRGKRKQRREFKDATRGRIRQSCYLESVSNRASLFLRFGRTFVGRFQGIQRISFEMGWAPKDASGNRTEGTRLEYVRKVRRINTVVVSVRIG